MRNHFPKWLPSYCIFLLISACDFSVQLQQGKNYKIAELDLLADLLEIESSQGTIVKASGGVPPYVIEILSGPGEFDSESGFFNASTQVESYTELSVRDSRGTVKKLKIKVHPVSTISLLPEDVSIVAGDTPNPGLLRFARSGRAILPLEFTIQFSGSAISGTDFLALPTTLTFPEGESSVDLIINPIKRGEINLLRSLEISVAPSDKYLLASTSSVELELGNENPPAPTKIVLEGPPTGVSGDCIGPFNFRTLDANNMVRGLHADKLFEISGRQGKLSLHLDASCDGNVQNDISLSVGQSAASFFLKGLGNQDAPASYNFEVTAAGLTKSSILNYQDTYGLPIRLAYEVQPSSSATATQSFSRQPKVKILDSRANRVHNNSDNIVLSAYTNSNCSTSASGTLGNGNQAASQGLAEFSGLSYSIAGSIYLRASASDYEGICSNQVSVAGYSVPAEQNMAPVVNAGDTQTIVIGQSATLSATVTDDGLPSGSVLSFEWSKVSGAGTVNFSNPSQKTTNVSFGSTGTYSLQLTASDSALSSSATVTLIVNPADDNLPIVAQPVDCAATVCRYVRSGANGTNSGLDWTNAFPSLPNPLLRGATYFIADGSYSSYTFDDPVSGSQYITIKKATLSDHGTNTGWTNSYGDGQAIFRTSSGQLFTLRTHYLIIDGSVRNQSDWSDTSKYGFVFSVDDPNRAKIFGMSWEQPNDVWNGASNIIIKNVYASFPNVCYSDECYLNNIIIAQNSNNISMTDSMLANTSWHAAIRINRVDGLVIERNYFYNIYKKELISDQCCSKNVSFRNNFIENVAGTAAIAFWSALNWNISNNVWWSPDSRYSFSDGIITTWTGQNQSTSNVKIYGNTFYQMRGALRIGSDGGSGNEFRNNLFIGFSPGITSSTYAASNNITNGASSLVNNAAGGDFTLRAPTAAGSSRSSPDNRDFFGKMRGADGNWDIGAFEFESP